MRKIAERLAVSLRRADPRIGRDMGDGVVVAGNELTVRETMIEHAIKTCHFPRIAVDRIRHGFGRIDIEMPDLPSHWPEAADLPEQPLQHLKPAARVLRHEAAGLF